MHPRSREANSRRPIRVIDRSWQGNGPVIFSVAQILLKSSSNPPSDHPTVYPGIWTVKRSREAYQLAKAAVILYHHAVPGLIDALRDPDPQTRVLSARALEQIGTPRAIAAVAVWRERED